MNLNDFVIQEARPLPVFLLVDTSGSMNGSKIDTVNVALKEMLQVLSNIEGTKGQIKLSIITFGKIVKVVQNLENVEVINLDLLQANGNTPMGEAIKTVVEMIENKEVVSSRAYNPTIVLISDGIPTDCPRETLVNTENGNCNYNEWEPIKMLHNSPRTEKCSKLALGIGDDSDFEMLKSFINNKEIPVIKANEAATISKFFKWVTMSVSKRSLSSNPNTCDEVPFKDVFGDVELVF